MKLVEPLHESVLTEQEVFVRKCGFFSITFDQHCKAEVPGGHVSHHG